MKDRKNLAIIISAIALVVSIITLYLTLLRGPVIKATTGEYLYAEYLNDGKFSLNIPLVFTNTGARMGTVLRVAVLVQPPAPQYSYLLEPKEYQRINEGGRFSRGWVPHPVAVLPRSGVVKNTQFSFPQQEFQNRPFVKSGKYRLSVLCWIKDAREPDVIDSFDVAVSDDDIRRLLTDVQEEQTNIRLRRHEWERWKANHPQCQN